MARNEHTTDYINQLDEEDKKAVAVLVDGQQDWLDVILDKDSRYGQALVDFLALLRNGVLVGEDGAGADAVDGGHDGEVVLELVEVGGGEVDGAVERVDEGRVEVAKREFGDDVGEVEF